MRIKKPRQASLDEVKISREDDYLDDSFQDWPASPPNVGSGDPGYVQRNGRSCSAASSRTADRTAR